MNVSPRDENQLHGLDADQIARILGHLGAAAARGRHHDRRG